MSRFVYIVYIFMEAVDVWTGCGAVVFWWVRYTVTLHVSSGMVLSGMVSSCMASLGIRTVNVVWYSMERYDPLSVTRQTKLKSRIR